MRIEKGVDLLEYLVDLVVVTAAGPPPLDNASVVSINFEARSGCSSFDD